MWISSRALLRRWSVLALVALLLAGCTSQISGDARPYGDVAAASARLASARAALGELRSLDYCTLLGGDGPGRTVDGDQLVRGMDFCATFGLSAGARVEVMVGPVHVRPKLPDHQLRALDQLPPPLRVNRPYTKSDGSCEILLAFPGKELLRFRARHVGDERPPPTEQLCDLAESTLRHAVERMGAGEVGHVTHGPKSLGLVDACSLLTKDELAAVFYTAEAARPSPTGHHCQWVESDVLEFHKVDIYLDREGILPAPDNRSVVKETIAGRESYVLEEADDRNTYCSVWAAHKADEQPLVEAAKLVVTDGNNALGACAVARRLAGLAWARLPAL
ncbi:hypothetical protein [Alloactinosynnema sp. L-07]|uniref:DUF3558 family protein n=1 Tax=Alloactinosynnema sp. L-07 TaxID=1653480 RepID=UPI00065EFE5E|nr:DUF3558 family protein [Alloactinosynnema sp. L-07]CRK59668.1 hypothetical protein [Alloactinosynnema sp. L-07]